MSARRAAVLLMSPRAYQDEALAPSVRWKREMRSLVGFDVEWTRERMQSWLRENEGAESPRARMAARDRRTVANARAQALIEVIARLDDLEDMWAPERLAARRWYRALEQLEKALEIAREAATIRVDEEARFASRMSAGRKSGRKRADRAAGVLRGLGALARRSRDARALIPRYENDTLAPADAAHRATSTHRGGLELDLFQAGFKQTEIATLFVDGSDSKGAAERVRKRIAEARARRARETGMKE